MGSVNREVSEIIWNFNREGAKNSGGKKQA